MHEAKSKLSKLVEEIESGRENQIIIARNGKPIARLIGFSKSGEVKKRIGIACGKFIAPEPSEELDNVVSDLFDSETKM